MDENTFFEDAECKECPDAATGTAIAAVIMIVGMAMAGLVYGLHEQNNRQLDGVGVPLRRAVHEARTFSDTVGLVPKVSIPVPVALHTCSWRPAAPFAPGEPATSEAPPVLPQLPTCRNTDLCVITCR